MGNLRLGPRMSYPEDFYIPTNSGAMVAGSSQLLDDATEYVDILFDAEDSDPITDVLIRFGAIATPTASFPVSLRNIDTTVNPCRGGSTVHVSTTINNTGMATTSQLVSFGAGYTPSKGEAIACRMGLAAAGSCNIVPTFDKNAVGYPYAISFLGGAASIRTNVLWFGYKSGSTWKKVENAYPAGNIGTTGYSTGSVDTEYGMRRVMPYSMMVDTFLVFMDADNSDTFDIFVYDENMNVLATRSLVGQMATSGSFSPRQYRLPSAIPIRAGKVYYQSVKVTSATAIDVQWMDTYDAAGMNAFLGNSEEYQVRRTGSNAWTPTTTRKLFMGFKGYMMSL